MRRSGRESDGDRGGTDGAPQRARRRWLGLLAGGASLALLAGLGVAYATQRAVFAPEGPVCWGAWEPSQAPLSDIGGSVREDEAPTSTRPTGTCVIARSVGQGRSAVSEVTVRYGRLPEDADERLAWLVQHVHGSAAPLPEGLPGLVDGAQGLLVLPPSCDVDGEPSVVTLSSKLSSADAWPEDRVLGSPSEVAHLLTAVADHGMAEAGCAHGAPVTTERPVPRLPERINHFSEVCQLPGLPSRAALVSSRDVRHLGMGAATWPGHICSGRQGHTESARQEGFLLVATDDDRLAELLLAATEDDALQELTDWPHPAGAHERLARVHARCGEDTRHDAVFVIASTMTTELTPEELLSDYVRAVEDTVNCAAVAPRV